MKYNILKPIIHNIQSSWWFQSCDVQGSAWEKCNQQVSEDTLYHFSPLPWGWSMHMHCNISILLMLSGSLAELQTCSLIVHHWHISDSKLY